jgi:hypothetical protein
MFSNYLEGKDLGHLFSGTPYTAPTTLYVALFTTLPANDGTGGTEISSGAYTRMAITFGAPSGGAPASVTNSNLVQFPTATAAWGTIVGCALYDATTAGNMLESGPLVTSKTVGNGDAFSFPVGTYTISLS